MSKINGRFIEDSTITIDHLAPGVAVSGPTGATGAPGAILLTAVVAATTSPFTATYDNNTLTGDVPLPVIDGVTLVAADRALVKNQSDAAHNGIYDVTSAGSAGSGGGGLLSAVEGEYPQYIVFHATSTSDFEDVSPYLYSLVFEVATNGVSYAGAPGINWRGDWQSGVAYEIDDGVIYGGYSHRCLNATDFIEPGSDPAYWRSLSGLAMLTFTKTGPVGGIYTYDFVMDVNANSDAADIRAAVTAGHELVIKSRITNSLYTFVNDPAIPATPWIFTRTSDFDGGSEVSSGSYVPVTSGSTLAGSMWWCTSTVASGNIGTDDINWVRLSGVAGATGASYIAGATSSTTWNCANNQVFSLVTDSSTPTITLSNMVSGMTVVGKVKSSVGSTVEFTGEDLKWSGAAATTVASGKTNIYTFIKINDGTSERVYATAVVGFTD